MSEAPVPRPAPSRRAYRSPRREKQAAETRDAVLGAAGRLFAEAGWARTGMRDVAREAGVAVETVYANFRSKGELLVAANDAAVVGDTREVPLADRAEFRALAAGDLVSRAAAAARLTTDIHRRIAGLHRALTHAAGTDDALAAELDAIERRRRTSVGQGAEMVAGRPVDDRTVAGLTAVLGSDVYLLLTGTSGWSDEEYESWMADTILRLLAEPPVPR